VRHEQQGCRRARPANTRGKRRHGRGWRIGDNLFSEFGSGGHSGAIYRDSVGVSGGGLFFFGGFGLGIAEGGRDKIKVLVVAVCDFVNLCSRAKDGVSVQRCEGM